MMSRYILLIAVAMIACLGAASLEVCAGTLGRASQTENVQAVDQERERTLRGLIDDLDEIMQPPYEKKPGNEVRAVYFAVKEQMIHEGLTWSIIEDGKREVSASFVPAAKGKTARIEVNHALLDSARTHPTLAMTVIMHEMKHAHDYFTIGDEYKKYMKNRLEEFMYEMDALFIEALFIRDFLSPRYKNLTVFEQYVLASLEKDNLASVAVVFMAVDMDLTYDLYGLGKKLDNGMSCKDYFTEFSARGKAVFAPPIPSVDFQMFRRLVTITTFATLAAPLADGAMARNKRCKQDERKGAIGELNGYISRGNALIREHQDFISGYKKQVRQKYLVP
jgi:hypothetical protein